MLRCEHLPLPPLLGRLGQYLDHLAVDFARVAQRVQHGAHLGLGAVGTEPARTLRHVDHLREQHDRGRGVASVRDPPAVRPVGERQVCEALRDGEGQVAKR